MNLEVKKATQLNGKASHYMFVPIELVTEHNISKWLVVMYLYCQVRTGLDGIATIEIQKAVRWLGRKNNFNDRGINANLMSALRALVDLGYVNATEDKTEYIVNPEQRTGKEDFNRYTILYLDEVEKIINYCKEHKETHVEKILHLFAYYRLSIYRKKKAYVDYAEMYADYYTNIAKNTFMTIDTVRWATQILDKLNLIKHYTPETAKIGNEWCTNKTVFVNYEKRVGNQLIAGGDEYYKNELQTARMQLYDDAIGHKDGA